MTSPVLAVRPASARDPEADAPALREHLQTLWRARLLILGCTVLGAALAVVLAFISPRQYEAESGLAVSRSKIGAELGPSEPISTANFRPLIETRAVAARVIQDVGLDTAPFSISPSRFFGDVVEITEVRNSTVMLIRGHLDDPVKLAAMVNRVAEVGVETARRISQKEASQARDDIKLQLDEAKTRLDKAVEALRSARVNSQLELVKRDVASALEQRGGLLDLTIAIQSERASLITAERELAARSRVETVHRTIDSEPTLMEAARTTGGKPGDVLGLKLNSEEVNPVYQTLDKQVATSRTNLAGLERQRAELHGRNLDGPDLSSLTKMYEKEAEIDRLEMERDLAKKVYQEVATSYETARLLVAGRSSGLQVINVAIPPDKPESRKVVRNLLIGATSGFLLAALFVLISRALAMEAPLPERGRA